MSVNLNHPTYVNSDGDTVKHKPCPRCGGFGWLKLEEPKGPCPMCGGSGHIPTLWEQLKWRLIG